VTCLGIFYFPSAAFSLGGQLNDRAISGKHVEIRCRTTDLLDEFRRVCRIETQRNAPALTESDLKPLGRLTTNLATQANRDLSGTYVPYKIIVAKPWQTYYGIVYIQE
jgi:hypothetical protein